MIIIGATDKEKFELALQSYVMMFNSYLNERQRITDRYRKDILKLEKNLNQTDPAGDALRANGLLSTNANRKILDDMVKKTQKN